MLRIVYLLLLSFFISFCAFALENPQSELEEVGAKPVLGGKIDLNLPFKNQEGKDVTLRDLLLPARPFIILPVYYDCPRLCGLTLTGVTELLNKLQLTVGRDFSLITVSFDHTETADLAQKTAEKFRHMYRDLSDAERGWHFLVGSETSVKTLMDQIHFRYRYDNGEFAHTTLLLVLTHEGEISQYFTGIEFPPKDVKLSLVDASRGNIGTAFDHIMLFCFRFDPTKGRYTWAVVNLLRITGALTILFLGGLFVRLRMREKLQPVA